MEQKKKAKKSFRFLFVLPFAFAISMFMTSAAFADAEVSDWAGLQGAFNNGEDAVLTDNITAAEDSKKLVVPNEKNVTLDLNGHTIDYSAAVMDTLHGVGGPAITVDGGSLTLRDSSTDAAGKITGGKCLTGSVNCGGGVLVNSGSFTMESGEISGNSAINGGGVFVGNNVTFTMKGGKISNNGNSNTGSLGGGVFVDGGKFLMEGGEISGNELGSDSLDWGGGVYVANGNFTMKGGKIADNKADYGGGVSTGYTASANPSFNMEGGEISGNTANKGGGVSLVTSDFDMRGGTISGNIGTELGGGVYLIGTADDPSTLKLAENVVINGNKNSTASDAANSNVYFETTTASEKITLTDPLTEDASIGVTMKNPGVFTSSNETHASDYAGCFFSDNGELAVQAEGNELKLAEVTEYPVWVGATQVTKANKNDVIGDGGKAKYDPDTNTLTLNNPKIKDFYSGPNAPHASIYAKQNKLVIKGSANLTNPDTTDEACGIYVSGSDVELNGDFTIKATYYGIGASGGDITISGGNVNVTSDAGIQGNNIKIKGGTLTSAARHFGLQALDEIILEDGMQIVRPAGGQIGGDEHIKWINDADGNRANVVVISSEKDLLLVTFVDGQGKILKADAVKPGQAATAPANPTREGYNFVGWDTDFSNITADLTVTAKWKESATPTPSKPVSIANAKVVLSASSFAYNGKVRKPSIKTIGGKTLKSGTDYTVTWSNKSSKNVGAYTVTITGKGKYTGVTKATYKINPKGTKIKKLKKAKKAIKVKWKKQSAKMSKSRITGYQIQLATNKKFTKNKKTVTVKGYKKTSKKVKKLKGGKKYYVKIRTYKTIKGKKYYSKWSKVKTIKTKK